MSANTAESMDGVPPVPEAPMFVINLCASTTPVALAHPNSPELQRYTFFVTRRREDGRDRFRLHMGYFDTQEEADALLAAARDVYPAAWAGPAPGNRPAVRSVAVEAAAVPAPATAALAGDRTLNEMSNVREVIAQLEQQEAELTATQTLRLLEDVPPRGPISDSAIRMITPDDTQALRDISLDTQNRAAPCFAVQLLWSVTPIEMTRLPQPVVFSAYTLYHVEGSRQGRRWYGLRLGFFDDVQVAKQVAYSLRVDYSSVVVVPVAIKERERAKGEVTGSHALPELQPAPLVESTLRKSADFELLVDDTPSPPKRDLGDAPAPVGAKVNLPSTVPLPKTLAIGKKPTGKRVVVRKVEPGQAAPLDSTLEMLGADTLTLDDAKSLLDDSGLRRRAALAPVPPKGGMRFTRLLGALTQKLGDPRR